MSFLASLEPKYRLILCDVWGVIHDGVTLYPGSEERLRQWRQEGRCVVLMTNAPRTADAVERQLAQIGLPRSSYDFVATSGEVAASMAFCLSLGISIELPPRAIFCNSWSHNWRIWLDLPYSSRIPGSFLSNVA